MRLFLILLFAFTISAIGWGQEYNYVHYNAKDGLAASTVYDMCQDRDGFMWFATENGLSRFDGKSFFNFTVKDGLPDNEVLTLFPDQKGRIWIGSFSKELCYYYRGKIYNERNTAFLKKIKWVSNITSIRSDKVGNLYISDQTRFVRLNANNEWDELDKTPSFFRFRNKRLDTYYFINNEFPTLKYGDSTFLLKNDTLQFYKLDTGKTVKDAVFASVNPGSKIIKFPDASLVMRVAVENGWIRYVCTSSGAWLIDTTTSLPKRFFLPGEMVSYVLRDNEKNLWFSTIGNGIFKLPSEETKTFKLIKNNNARSLEVFTIFPFGDLLYCGANYSSMAKLRKLKYEGLIDFQNETKKSTNNFSSNRLYCSYQFSPEVIFLGFDAFLAKMTAKGITYNELVAIKSIDKYDEQHITVGTFAGLFKVRVSDMAVVDTFWNSRVTKSITLGGTCFVGTTNGLYAVDKNKKSQFLGTIHPALKRRVSGLCIVDGVLWVATSDHGVVGLKGNNIVANYTTQHGLSSDICKTIFANGKTIWVGTNTGLNKIDVSRNPKPIVKYGILDGLPSNIINAIYVEDSIVYVGSPEGLTYFNQKKIESNSICNLQMLHVDVDTSTKLENGVYKIRYKTNSIGFRYTAISFRSAGQIAYHYRLNGLDESWKTTSENQLNFPVLPAGDYVFEIYAINKFGVSSDVQKVPFSIVTPFWQSPLFFVLMGIAIILFTVWVVNIKNRTAHLNLQHENEVQKKLNALEQQALQAQMNPHFIFNCLNSIQHFFLTNDGHKANRYLSLFATLVRETLYFSSRQAIKVAEEVQYLKQYLEMEQMRFGEKFSYSMHIDSSVETDFIEMPALLLQPYVENAIRHGIRHKVEGIGKLDVSFKAVNELLYCSVLDNGIGRQKSEEIKGRQHIEYQSRGMELGQKRIELWNGLYPEKQIQIEVIDLKDQLGNAIGTEVIIKLNLANVE